MLNNKTTCTLSLSQTIGFLRIIIDTIACVELFDNACGIATNPPNSKTQESEAGVCQLRHSPFSAKRASPFTIL